MLTMYMISNNVYFPLSTGPQKRLPEALAAPAPRRSFRDAADVREAEVLERAATAAGLGDAPPSPPDSTRLSSLIMTPVEVEEATESPDDPVIVPTAAPPPSPSQAAAAIAPRSALAEKLARDQQHLAARTEEANAARHAWSDSCRVVEVAQRALQDAERALQDALRARDNQRHVAEGAVERARAATRVVNEGKEALRQAERAEDQQDGKRVL